MLMSLLGSSLLSAGLGGGNFKDTIKNIGLGFAGNFGTAIPALFGSIGQSGKRLPSYGDTGLGRSLLATNKQIAKIGLAKKQRDIIKKARVAQGTINTYLAGRGFAPGGSTAMILSNQNLNNAMEDIEMASLETHQRVLEAQVKQLQDDYSMMNNFEADYLAYESPAVKFVKESFLQPMIKQNYSEIGKKVSSSINGMFDENRSTVQAVKPHKNNLVEKYKPETPSRKNPVQSLISNSWMI